jgi:hypothetical protein
MEHQKLWIRWRRISPYNLRYSKKLAVLNSIFLIGWMNHVVYKFWMHPKPILSC